MCGIKLLLIFMPPVIALLYALTALTVNYVQSMYMTIFHTLQTRMLFFIYKYVSAKNIEHQIIEQTQHIPPIPFTLYTHIKPVRHLHKFSLTCYLRHCIGLSRHRMKADKNCGQAIYIQAQV